LCSPVNMTVVAGPPTLAEVVHAIASPPLQPAAEAIVSDTGDPGTIGATASSPKHLRVIDSSSDQSNPGGLRPDS
jgi:hypothetical protein